MLPPSPRDFKDIYVVFELMETDLHQVRATKHQLAAVAVAAPTWQVPSSVGQQHCVVQIAVDTRTTRSTPLQCAITEREIP
jgi:hypothetical protein